VQARPGAGPPLVAAGRRGRAGVRGPGRPARWGRARRSGPAGTRPRGAAPSRPQRIERSATG